jgi:soluble cytochrome b562
MKIRLVLVPLIVCGLIGALAVRAQDMKKDDQTELGAKMEKIGGAFRATKKQVADPSKNEDTLKRLATIKENMEAALKLQPEKTKDLPPEDQAKFVADFQAKMKDEIAKIDQLTALVKAGNNEEAAKLVSEINQDQNDAHKQFKKKKQKKQG